ncbi:hypothetical protein RI129_007774 [Pyrocoelia pectoralis]|uniref:Cytochrome P450 n=1 Tax=Pyrocoelia pectoralis TaxID=417401 RepID=A0AAN7VCZ3_9COLE
MSLGITTREFHVYVNVFQYLIIFTLMLWYMYWQLSKRYVLKLAEKLPGPKGWPLIGNALEFRGSAHEIMKKLCRHLEINSVVKLWQGSKLIIFLSDPKDVEIILSSYDHIDKSSEYDLFKPWLGNGLLISTGKTWKSHRKLIYPTFHMNILKKFIVLFNTNSRETVEKLRKEVGKTFDCHDYMSEATVEMLLETAMGVNKKTQERSGYEYAQAVMKMCDILHSRHMKIWLKPDWIFKLSSYGRIQKEMLNIIHSLTNKIIKNKMEALNELSQSCKNASRSDTDVEEKRRVAFLDLLVEASQNGEHITRKEIREQVDTIMFEGHDTTAAAASFFLSLMAAHPDIQNRVSQELDEIFGNSDRFATFSDTLQMKYLERCLLETLRLYPPVPLIARHLNQPVKLVSGNYVLPPGCTVVIATIKLHRREEIYANPNKYEPDNFLPERAANRNYYDFIPFSAGPRNCVGRKYAMLKLKVLLSTVMRNFYIRSYMTEKDFKLQGDIILKREEGFQVRLEPRKYTDLQQL